MLILVDPDAVQYIRDHTGAVVVRLQFEPSIGGCACSASRLAGTYIPTISTGRPSADEAHQFQSQHVGGIDVFFPAGLSLKQGSGELRVKLRGCLGLHWLEVEGARGISSLND